MNFSDIKAIQQIADSNIDPRSALVQQAGDRVLQEYHGSLMFPLVGHLTRISPFFIGGCQDSREPLGALL
ncbi:hypothetical protein NDI52_31055 [Leptolyngbya sp. PL-A3]|uniref:hypothetical protein n=1 Tax=Leptolyngbya sp. PL-A3 TaxID=2933911 RepID=UPI0032968372